MIIVPTIEVSGYVYNEIGKPFANVNVFNRTGIENTKTNAKGFFVFAVPLIGEIDLKFTHLGYATEIISVKSFNNSKKITMNPNFEELDEVIIGMNPNDTNKAQSSSWLAILLLLAAGTAIYVSNKNKPTKVKI
jgi:hypothetical protein